MLQKHGIFFDKIIKHHIIAMLRIQKWVNNWDL
jgi:hypothetical protein